jgi:hypothetical protein
MPNDWTGDDLKRQLRTAKANGLFAALQAGAKKHGLSLPYVLAIASRETNITNELGDGGNGVGPMQLDRRSHSIPADWRTNPAGIVDQCCAFLAGLITWAKREYPAYNTLKIAAAAYNAGEGGASRGVTEGNCDAHTTGGDYGGDVLKRAAVFAQLLGVPAP